MATLKEFEEALREHGQSTALDLLRQLRDRDRAARTIRPARRVVGRKMTPDLAREILDLHDTTEMTQQEIAFRLGINQGRVNEVIKHGKWLTEDPGSPEALSRDRALARMDRQAAERAKAPRGAKAPRRGKPAVQAGPLAEQAPATPSPGPLADAPFHGPHPEVPERSGGLEGGLQDPQSRLEPSFEARLRLAPQDEGEGGRPGSAYEPGSAVPTAAPPSPPDLLPAAPAPGPAEPIAPSPPRPRRAPKAEPALQLAFGDL